MPDTLLVRTPKGICLEVPFSVALHHFHPVNAPVDADVIDAATVEYAASFFASTGAMWLNTGPGPAGALARLSGSSARPTPPKAPKTTAALTNIRTKATSPQPYVWVLGRDTAGQAFWVKSFVLSRARALLQMLVNRGANGLSAAEWARRSGSLSFSSGVRAVRAVGAMVAMERVVNGEDLPFYRATLLSVVRFVPPDDGQPVIGTSELKAAFRQNPDARHAVLKHIQTRADRCAQNTITRLDEK